MTIKKRIYTAGGIAFFIFIVLALMNIWSHQQVLSHLRVRDKVNEKLAGIKEFAKWKNELIFLVSDIVSSGHVPPYAKNQLNLTLKPPTQKSDDLMMSGTMLVDLIGEKEHASHEVENTFRELRVKINDIYYNLDKKISTVLAVAQLDEVMGIDSSKKSSLAPYVLKSLNQLTIVASNTLIARDYTVKDKGVVVKNEQFLSSQLHMIDEDGSIAVLFGELFAKIESIEAFILDSRKKLAGFETQITEAKALFDKAVRNTEIDTIIAEVQSEVVKARERLENASQLTLVTVIAFLIAVPIAVMVFGIYGLNTIVVGPITHLMEAMKNVEGGNFDVTAPMKTNDEIGKLAGAFNKMTEKLLSAEKELGKYRSHLEDLVEKRTAALEAKNKELEIFTYSVSHDLKAPLRGIDGYSRLLVEDYSDKLDEEGLLFLNNVRKSAEQMNQLIEDLLAYSRMERRQLQPVSIALGQMMDMMISQRERDIETGNISISVNLPFETVISDTETLRQVLGNYLDNAIKFSKKDAAGTVEIGGEEDPESWTLWVKDNGIGFDPQYNDRIFGIFQRLHRSEDYPGTGVGLAIVRKAVERVGGRVWAESEAGKGAAFFITIPKQKRSI